MSSIGEVNLQKPFCFESHKRNYKRLTYIQVALVTITAVGIVLSVVSHFGYLDHVFIKIGIGVAVPSYVIGAIVLYFRRHSLDKAVQATTSFDELKEILQETKLHIHINLCILLCGCLIGILPTAGVYSKVLGGEMNTGKLFLKIQHLEIDTQNESEEDQQYIKKLFDAIEHWGWEGYENDLFTENGELKA